MRILNSRMNSNKTMDSIRTIQVLCKRDTLTHIALMHGIALIASIELSVRAIYNPVGPAICIQQNENLWKDRPNIHRLMAA